MSYIVKNKNDIFLVSFNKVKEDEFMILATNRKQFYVQKGINSEYIQEQFDESITRIIIKLPKILKIIQEEEPTNESELKVTGNELNLLLKFQISLKNNLNDSFKINFKLQECTSINEIGELFFTGLLKSLIQEKIKSDKNEKFNLTFPMTSFEGTFKVNDSNIADLCHFIGGEIALNTDNDKKSSEDVQSVPTQSVTQKSIKRPIALHNELKFKDLDDSQEIDTVNLAELKEVPPKIVKTTKKKMNIKF